MVDSRGESALEFETAQGAVFDAAGLSVESSFIDLETPAVRTHLFEAGDVAGAGPPLLFLHGSAAFGAFLAPLMGELEEYRLIGFDRPGHGLSGPYEFRPGSVRRTTIETVESVLDALELERVDLVGHSMGAFAGIEFARTHPERVRTVSLVGSVPMFPGTSPPMPVRLSTTPVIRRVVERLQGSGEDGVLEIAEIFGERDTIQAYPELIRAIAVHEAVPKTRTAGQSEFRSLMTLRGWRKAVELREDQLASLPQPTTIVWGNQDPLGLPDEVRHGVESIPDVRFTTVDAGHMPFLGHPRTCAERIRELRG